MVPDFRAVPYARRSTSGASDPAPWQTAEGIVVNPRTDAAAVAGLPLDTVPGQAPYIRGPYPTMYVQQPWTIPPVCRVLDRRGVERVLPAQPRGGTEGPLGRVRPRHPQGLRFGPSAGDRRRRHGGGRDRLDPRHAHPVRRHPARRDDGVDDDERRRAAGSGALHRRRGRTGRAAGQARRHDPERHPEGVHGPQHVHLSASPVDADRVGHLRLHGAAHAAVQLDLDLRLPYAGGRRDGGPRARLHHRKRPRVHPRRRRGGARRGQVRPRASPSSGRSGCTSSWKSPRCGRRATCGRPSSHGNFRRRTRARSPCGAHCPDVGLVADGAGRLQQCRPAP